LDEEKSKHIDLAHQNGFGWLNIWPCKLKLDEEKSKQVGFWLTQSVLGWLSM
jgi:hypothetical protein